MLASLKNKDTYRHYFKTLRFALYILTHPLDGYWDLTHEKRGSIAAANTLTIVALVIYIARLQFTSFLFTEVYWETLNVFLYVAGVLLPLALWCVGNWGLTTLFNGKGRLKQVYMATAYGFTPFIIIQIPAIFLSNFVTTEEGAFYIMAYYISLIWCAILIVLGMMQIHEYKIGQTIFFTIATIFSMLVMTFLLLLFFSMFTQGIAYIISIYKEIMFRM